MANKNLTPDSLALKEALTEAEKEFHGSFAMFGMTLLTNPGYVSGNRCTMFTLHLGQFVNLLNPDFAKISTGFENTVGDECTGYYETDSTLELIKRVQKFDAPNLKNHIYYDFVYDRDRDMYDVIEKKIVEDLTEKFGFPYKTEVMDNLVEGSVIEPGTTLYQSTSYDEKGNYCYGVNAFTMFGLETKIIEDAVKINDRFAKDKLGSVESEVVRVALNDNDVLKNWYGDDEIFKGFPDIGENVKKKIVAATTRIHKKQILYQLKRENVKKINFNSDSPTYCSGTVIDINIYCNKPIDEIPRNDFNAQILYYLEMQNRFFEEIYEVTEELLHSGTECSKDINYLNITAKRFLSMDRQEEGEPVYKFRDDNGNVFSNLVIEFHIVRKNEVARGQKVTARCGNKGVISCIVPEEEMPFVIIDGEKKYFDIVYSSLGMPNRLITFPLFEQSISFIMENVIRKIKTCDNIKEKEEWLFDVVDRLNHDECTKMKINYKKKTAKGKRKFWEEVEAGIYTIVSPPLWEEDESNPLLDKIWSIYKDPKYSFIQPYQAYIHKWGRDVPILRKIVAGYMYIIKLKHTSKKNFSARSSGGLDQKGLPTKTTKSKFHEELYPDTPVTHGDQEFGNETIRLDPMVIARNKLHICYSKTARHETGVRLGMELNGIDRFEENTTHKNINVSILIAYLKCMGVRIYFDDEHLIIDAPVDRIETFIESGHIFIGSKVDYDNYNYMERAREFYEEDSVYIGDKEEYELKIKEKAEEFFLEDKNNI